MTIFSVLKKVDKGDVGKNTGSGKIANVLSGNVTVVTFARNHVRSPLSSGRISKTGYEEDRRPLTVANRLLLGENVYRVFQN
ncbi:MAG: hypothetical protein K6U74_11385 [Firmicutes bacterium]|nr:hypothetical protein [Bacillota bacterium]